MRGFRELQVWQKAHYLTIAIYRVSRGFPNDERYGLTSQIRRSAVSVCANLAESCGRSGKRDFGRFVQVALGSASELEYHLLLASELELLEPNTYAGLDRSVIEVKRMLTGLLRKLMADG